MTGDDHKLDAARDVNAALPTVPFPNHDRCLASCRRQRNHRLEQPQQIVCVAFSRLHYTAVSDRDPLWVMRLYCRNTSSNQEIAMICGSWLPPRPCTAARSGRSRAHDNHFRCRRSAAPSPHSTRGRPSPRPHHALRSLLVQYGITLPRRDQCRIGRAPRSTFHCALLRRDPRSWPSCQFVVTLVLSLCVSPWSFPNLTQKPLATMPQSQLMNSPTQCSGMLSYHLTHEYFRKHYAQILLILLPARLRPSYTNPNGKEY